MTAARFAIGARNPVQQPLSPEQLVFGMKRAGDPQISPDGQKVAFAVSDADRKVPRDTSHIWQCDLDSGNLRQLTWHGVQNSGARWSPDGRQIAFISNRVKQAGIFVLPVDEPGEACEVTRHNVGIGTLAWSPDGTRLAYAARHDPENPNEEDPPIDRAPRVRVTRRIDYKRDGDGYLGDARGHVFIIDVATGERQRVTSDLVEHNDPGWSPDGRWLAIQQVDWTNATSRLLLLDVASHEHVSIGAGTGGGSAGQHAWSPSGERIVFCGSEQFTAQPDLFVYDVASGETRQLTEDLSILPISPPSWLDERSVLLHAVRAGASGLYVVDSETGNLKRVERWRALHQGLSVSRDGQFAVQSRTSLEGIGEIVTYNLRTSTTRVITSLNGDVMRDSLPARWERFEIQRAGETIEAWLLMPPDLDTTKRYPVVLSVHGGPESFYGYAWHDQQQLLATNGFLVVAANPRGSTSYGRRFADAVLGDWGNEPLSDLLAALDHVLDRPYADPDRVGITGGSYGGYMTALAIGKTSRFAAAVCVAVTFDLESQYQSADFDHAYGDYAWGGPPHANRAWYDEQSPSTYAHLTTAPTLILHGEEDHRCPIGQAEQMFGALKKAGCEVELVRYPGGSHGFSRSGPPEHREDFLRRALAWFKEHLGEPLRDEATG